MPVGVEVFASAHGGLHRRPIRLPHRSWEDPGAEAWLFFVGVEVAQAAWTFTPKTGRFEQVEGWPKASRVIGNLQPSGSKVSVLLESVAARGQPAGLLGAVEVEESISTGGNMAVHSWYLLPALRAFQQRSPGTLRSLLSRREHHPSDAQRAAMQATLKRAASSPAAFAAALSKSGAAIWHVWQGRFGRTSGRLTASEAYRWKPSAPWLVAAEAALEDKNCFHQLCLDTPGRTGVALQLEDGSWKIQALVQPAPSPRAAEQSLPAAHPAQAGLAVARLRSDLTGWEVLEELRPGEQRALALLRLRNRSDRVYLAERDGAWTDLTEVPSFWPPNAKLSTRFVDLDQDGVLDVILHSAFEADRPADAEADTVVPPGRNRRGTMTVVLLRSAGIEGGPSPAGVDVSLAVADAPDLDRAIRAARGQLQEKRKIDPVKACQLVMRGAGRRFRGVAAPGAQVIFFSEPHEPQRADRVLPADQARRRDLERLGCCPESDHRCDSEDEVTSCRGAVCGSFGYMLGSFYQFTWIKGQLRLLKVAIYVGS